MTFQKIFRERRIAGHRGVAGDSGHIAEEIREVSQPSVGYTTALYGTRRIDRFVVIVAADVGPERIRMADECRLRVFLEDCREGFRVPRAPGPFVRSVIDFMGVNQDG